MTNHGRKYGEKQSRPIPVWNGVLEHCCRVACGIWVFLWCLDKITEEREGIGVVLGGAPVKISRIAADLQVGEHTVRRHCDHLEKQNYIRRRRTPYGFVIEVLNSRKFEIWHARENVKNGQSHRAETVQKRQVSDAILADLTDKNGRNKEDAAVNAAVDAAGKAPAAKSSLWETLGIQPKSLSPELRQLCESMYGSKGDQPMTVFLGLCMDLWTDQGEKIPAQLAKAAAEIREREKQRKATAFARPELEALPWANR